MHLMFAAEEEEAAAILGVDTYKLQLVDGTGQPVMTLRLSAQLIDPVVVTKLAHTISMAPDGTISVKVDGSAADWRHNEAGSIDTLVASAVQPSMLEDEPNALQLLATLRERLARTIALVDNAITRIR